jgi:hypothetical protein
MAGARAIGMNLPAVTTIWTSATPVKPMPIAIDFPEASALLGPSPSATAFRRENAGRPVLPRASILGKNVAQTPTVRQLQAVDALRPSSAWRVCIVNASKTHIAPGKSAARAASAFPRNVTRMQTAATALASCRTIATSSAATIARRPRTLARATTIVRTPNAFTIPTIGLAVPKLARVFRRSSPRGSAADRH